MAEEASKKRRIRKAETVRERVQKASGEQPAPRRLQGTASKVITPIKAAAKAGGKEYHPLRMPDNRLGRFLNRRVRFIPRFISEAWAELREVTWPNRKETTKLTTAVFIFAIVFGIFVALLDFVLDKIFKEVILR